MARGGRIRFLDQVSIVNPQIAGGETSAITLVNNEVSGRVLTSTDSITTISGSTDLIFINGKLGIGITSEPQAKLEISGVNEDLILIKNEEGNGIKFTADGVLQFLPYTGSATPIEGGIIYSGSEFFLGV